MTANEGTRRAVLAPTPFAQHLGEYLAFLVTREGGDLSGRWLSSRIDRGRTYCEKLLKVTQAMTTNDIALVAELFGISPYQFVRDARDWNGESDPVFDGPRIGPNVPGVEEDAFDAVARPADPQPTDEQ